jgi:hypothetical protein
MATLGDKYLNLADGLKRTEGGEQAATIIEMMSETNVVMQDANVMECNDGSNHVSTVRSGLPTATFRKIYGFVPPSKSTTVQVKDPTGMLETYSVIDKDLVDKAKNPKLFRLSESTAFIEAMNQELQENIFYGSVADNAAAFDGLAVRYAKSSTKKSEIGYNVVKGLGAGSDNTSIWFVTWGDQHCSLIYPEGSKAGLQHEDDGIVTETDANGGKRKVYQDHYKMDVGLTLRDFRSTARICNIDVSNLAGGSGATPDNLLDLMTKAYYKIKKHNMGGKTVIYCNTDLLMYFDKQVKNTTNIDFNYKEYLNDDILHFKNIPIRECDQILNTEAAVL